MTPRPDRRRGRRAQPTVAGWRAEAVLRPGLPVHVVDIGPYGALIECATRLRPGRAAELQLVSAITEHKRVVAGRVERCQVIRLQPLGFRGAIAFDGALGRAE